MDGLSQSHNGESRLLHGWKFPALVADWPLHALVAIVGLVIVWRADGATGFLAGWTVTSVPLIGWPLLTASGATRRRLLVAGAVLLAALLVAWRLDAQTELGVLALTANKTALIGLTLLAGVLGAVTATRSWLVLQTGIWTAAIALSGWWLSARADALDVLSAWRSLLPDKQFMEIYAHPTPLPFTPSDALVLGGAFAGLLATSAYAGLRIRGLADEGRDAFQFSWFAVAAVVGWLVFALVPDDYGEAGISLLVGLAILGGASASSARVLAMLPIAWASGVLTRQAVLLAWDGLPSWWGEIECDDFLGNTCTPSREVPWFVVFFVLLLLPAVLTYLGKRAIGWSKARRAH